MIMEQHDIHSMNENNYCRKIELVHNKESSKDALKIMDSISLCSKEDLF